MFLLVQLKNQTKVNGYFFESLSMTINFFKNLIAPNVCTYFTIRSTTCTVVLWNSIHIWIVSWNRVLLPNLKLVSTSHILSGYVIFFPPTPALVSDFFSLFFLKKNCIFPLAKVVAESQNCNATTGICRPWRISKYVLLYKIVLNWILHVNILRWQNIRGYFQFSVL